MIKVKNLPKDPFVLACSGGPDSMAALHFFVRAGKSVTALYVNHGTDGSTAAENLVRDFCKKSNTPFLTSMISKDKSKDTSREEFWRNERYKIFHSFKKPVVTVHHLNDSVETWIFSSLHGQGKIIPKENQNVIRPFLLTEKEAFLDYCKNNNVPFVLDPSNLDTSFMRNKIRHELMPLALQVNPGLLKVVRKKVLLEYNQNDVDKKNQIAPCQKKNDSVKMAP